LMWQYDNKMSWLKMWKFGRLCNALHDKSPNLNQIW